MMPRKNRQGSKLRGPRKLGLLMLEQPRPVEMQREQERQEAARLSAEKPIVIDESPV